MTDKQTILITGATGNVGGGAAIALAKRGARVVLLARKLETLEARADSIRVALSEARIECQDTDIATLVVDFTDMESVKLAAVEALNRFPRIHGLILSAVLIGQNAPKILPNGHEVRFATSDCCGVGSTICWQDLLCSIQSFLYHGQITTGAAQEVAYLLAGARGIPCKATCGRG